MSSKFRFIIFVILAIILIAIGVFASYLLIQRYQSKPAPVVIQDEIQKINVVVVTRDLFLGDTLIETDLKITSVPVEIAPRNALRDTQLAVGKIIKTDLIQGEILLFHNLADPTNNNQDLSFILSEDHVMLAFPADDLMSRESMVQRGDIVDIFATFKQKIRTVNDATTPEQEEPEMRTFTVDTMQKVGVTALVLEVIEQEEQSNSNLLPGQTGEETIVKPEIKIKAYLLALNPQDALVLKHLKDTDAIFDIVLRAPTSSDQFELTPVTEEYIIEFYGLEILP